MIFPVMYAEWVTPPDVIVCEVANVSQSDLDFVTAWWEERGYKFGEIVHDFKCPKKSKDFFLPDTIVVYDDNHYLYKEGIDSYSKKAVTVVNHNSGKLKSALIEIEPVNKMVLAHEFGHALGWRDFPCSGHIMNGTYHEMGWNDDGIAK